ncbi:MAG: hypothetical protein AB7L13_18880 [Acidimicrobiia bacterium]
MGRVATLLRSLRSGKPADTTTNAGSPTWAPPLPPPRAEERIDDEGQYEYDDGPESDDGLDHGPPDESGPSTEPDFGLENWTDWNNAANARAAEPDWSDDADLAPPPPPPPAISPVATRRAFPVKAVLIGALALVVAVAGVVTISNRPPGPPKVWDPQVKPIANFVETERSLFFKHPVPVEYLEDAAFRARIDKLNGGGSKSDKAKDAATDDADTAMFRALGLASGSSSVANQSDVLTGEGVLAFYSFGDRKIVVRGTTLDLATKVTLAHELTHALDDQHFDLVRTRTEAGSSLASLALIEGNAVAVEQSYIGQLSEADQETYYRTVEDQLGTYDTNTKDVSTALQDLFEAPYRLGPALIAVIREANGPGAINDALRNPPQSEEQVLVPTKYLTNDRPKAVGTPSLTAGETLNADAHHDEPFGAFGLYIVLAARIDPKIAFAAAQGWGGDDYVQFTKAGQQCVRMAFAGDAPADTDRIAAAFDQWIATRPAGNPGTVRHGELVELTVCDPGAAAATPPTNAHPGTFAFTRAELVAALLDSSGATKVDPAVVECAVDKVAATVDLAALGQDPSTIPADLQSRLVGALTGCKR